MMSGVMFKGLILVLEWGGVDLAEMGLLGLVGREGGRERWVR